MEMLMAKKLIREARLQLFIFSECHIQLELDRPQIYQLRPEATLFSHKFPPCPPAAATTRLRTEWNEKM